MLTLQQIKQDPQDIIRRLAVKGFDGTEPINRILELDASNWRTTMPPPNSKNTPKPSAPS